MKQPYGNYPEFFRAKLLHQILSRTRFFYKARDIVLNDCFSGTSPAPFVGHSGYPKLNVGILSPPEERTDAWLFDAPKYWGQHRFDIPRIVDLRMSLVNSRFPLGIRQQSRFLDISQEVAMSSQPLDLEFHLKEKPRFRLNLSLETPPYGPNAHLRSVNLISNPRIHPSVERVFSDSDFRASSALLYLNSRGFDENFLTRLLSVGVMGVKPQRKLVPTRWAITAVDDTLGKALINEINGYETGNHELYYGSYLGNHFFVLLFPRVWSFELFETYMPTVRWLQKKRIMYTSDCEGYQGRKSYAENCGGGYYAARLPVLQKLAENKKQASVLVLRFITEDYAMPLGVWVVREAVRNAMGSGPVRFETREGMLDEVQKRVSSMFSFSPDFFYKRSILLRGMKEQRKISEFQ